MLKHPTVTCRQPVQEVAVPALKDITGQRFGRWIVVARGQRQTAHSGRWRLTYWLCRCDCGAEKEVRAQQLIAGHSQSCGCLRQEFYDSLRIHGETTRLEGGKRQSSAEYKVWQNMLNRCRNPKVRSYRSYGGRGITVCERWNSFEAFLADMGRRPSERHSLDRIDVNKGYFKTNCRWATADVQRINKRKIATIDQFTIAELKAELARRKSV